MRFSGFDMRRVAHRIMRCRLQHWLEATEMTKGKGLKMMTERILGGGAEHAQVVDRVGGMRVEQVGLENAKTVIMLTGNGQKLRNEKGWKVRLAFWRYDQGIGVEKNVMLAELRAMVLNALDALCDPGLPEGRISIPRGKSSSHGKMKFKRGKQKTDTWAHPKPTGIFEIIEPASTKVVGEEIVKRSILPELP